MPDVPPMIRQQQILSEISRWAAGRGTPGWDRMEVHLVAHGRAWDVGFVVRHGTRSTGWVGPVEPGGPLEADADELRRTTYRHPVGAMQSVIIALGATGWPEPQISIDASYNYDDEPQYVVDDQPRVTAHELVDDYTRFPRTRAATPAWVLERVQSAGLRLPFVEDPTPPAPAWPAGRSDDAAATVGTRTDETAPAREEQTLPSAESPAIAEVGGTDAPPVPGPSGHEVSEDEASKNAAPRPAPPPSATATSFDGPALAERPADLDLVIDRDGIPLSDGRRPQQRRGRIDGRASWRDILVSIGTPLVFVDGAGAWVVVRRAAGFADVVVGVVEQTAITAKGLPEVGVHPVSEHDPWELADADAHLELHYLSASGPVEEVLEAARYGHIWQKPAIRGLAPDNVAVRAALAAHDASPSHERALDVLRQAFGGVLVLDVTGSELDQDPPRLAISYVRGPDDARALPAYTRHAELSRFRAADEAPVHTLVQPAHAVLQQVADDTDVGWLYLDPAGPMLGIPRDALATALRDGHNHLVKDLLAHAVTAPELPEATEPPEAGTDQAGIETAGPLGTSRPPSMQELFDALRADDGFLFLAEHEVDGRTQPVSVHGADGRAVLLAFTSPVEIGAYDPALGYRKFPVGWILELLLDNRAAGLRINPGGPSLDLDGFQVWHMLANPSPGKRG